MTIVAAWISAETGVGPAIASGNQTKSGICADLPVAPTKRSNAIAVITPKTPNISAGCEAACSRKLGTPLFVTKLIVPNVVKMMNIAIMYPKSPIRLVIKAFFAASPASFRRI